MAKYADHAPLERQVRIMAREGLVIDEGVFFEGNCSMGAGQKKAPLAGDVPGVGAGATPVAEPLRK